MSTWDEIDERVLRWLLTQDSDPKWQGRTENLVFRPQEEPRPEFDGALDSRQVDDALRRLHDHGLIDGTRGATTHYAYWSQLRVTANGLIILGHWPDLDRVASYQGLTTLVARLAEQTEDQSDKAALRQTAGAIGRLGEDVVESALESLGGELAAG